MIRKVVIGGIILSLVPPVPRRNAYGNLGYNVT